MTHEASHSIVLPDDGSIALESGSQKTVDSAVASTSAILNHVSRLARPIV